MTGKSVNQRISSWPPTASYLMASIVLHDVKNARQLSSAIAYADTRETREFMVWLLSTWAHGGRGARFHCVRPDGPTRRRDPSNLPHKRRTDGRTERKTGPRGALEAAGADSGGRVPSRRRRDQESARRG